MEADAVFGMSALTRGVKRAVGLCCELYPKREQLVYNLRRGFYHALHRGGIVFRMPRAHCVRKIAFKIVLALHTTDAALCKIAVAFFRITLAD